MGMLCFVSFHPLCGLTKYTAVGTALSPTLTMVMPATDPGDSGIIFTRPLAQIH